MTWSYLLVNRIRVPEGKEDLWLKVSVSEHEGHRKIAERWTAEKIFTLAFGSVHRVTSFSIDVAPVGPMRLSQQ